MAKYGNTWPYTGDISCIFYRAQKRQAPCNITISWYSISANVTNEKTKAIVDDYALGVRRC